MATAAGLIPLSPGDLDALTVDVGPAPGNLEVVLELPGVSAGEAPRIVEVLADRIESMPALGRAVQREGRRLFWAHKKPRPDTHIRIVEIGGGEPLVYAAQLLTRRIELSSPPWAITLLAGDAGIWVVFVGHHVLTDGLHGLAMLDALADAHAAAHETRMQRPTPRFAPARSRRRLRLAPRTSLNRPTGPDRVIATYDIPLAALRDAAHRAEATVNDVLLVAISQAVASELHRRGEHPGELRVWVPVARSGPASREQGGNALGVMLVPVDLTASPQDRLAQVSAYTTQRKVSARRPKSMRAAHLFSQVVGRLGLASLINQHQRIGNTSLSTMRGPAEPLHLAGHPIARVVPAASRAANIGVSFIALSYAGMMTISVVADPDQLSETRPMVADLAGALGELLG